MLFTSGSTGAAKGVSIEHRNLLNLLQGAPELAPEPQEGALHVCAPQFDVAAYEIWATLLNGARLVCHPPGRPDPRMLAATIAEHRVTWSMMPTSVFHQMAESCPEGLAPLRMLLAGGEPMRPRYARRVLRACPDTRLLNVYGPAETTVFMTVQEVDEELCDGASIPIGRPIAGAELRILDEQGRPVGDGERGDLHVGGPCLVRGYLNRPDLTAERFTDCGEQDGAPGPARLYRSGDIVRMRPDGALEIFGRTDDQVKLSGYRVEPREVELVLTEQPSVSGAAVIAREDVPGHRRLVAYVVSAGGRFDEPGLRSALAERLPPYALPSAIVSLERLPMTPNYKIDRAALPAPGASTEAGPDTPDGLQGAVLEVFREVLGVHSAGVMDDFFELGGNSLLAVQALVRLRERLGVELPLSAVFDARTAAGLAASVGSAPLTPGPPPLLAHAHEGSVPATAGQAKALLLGELAGESLPYQSQAIHRIVGRLDAGALERALSALVRRHEILRTTFEREGGRWQQHIHAPWRVRLGAEDLSREPDPQAALDERFAQLRATRLDPGQLPLVRWSLVRLGEREHALLSVEHHVVHDGVSTAVALRELAALYTAEVEQAPAGLAEPTVQFRDFALWQQELVDSDFGRGLLEYWEEYLRDAPRSLEVPRDRPRPARQSFRGHTLRLRVPADLAERIEALGRDSHTSTFSIMLAAYAALLGRYSHSDELVIGSGLANRRTLASEQIVGMLVNTVALRIDLSGAPSPRELAARAHAAVLEAQEHQDVPFEHVVRHLGPRRSAAVTPVYQTLFSFHDAPVRTLALPGAALIPGDALPNGSAKAELSVVVIDRSSERPETVDAAAHERLAEEGLTIVWEYNSDLFDRTTAERMLGHYRELLEQFAAGAREPAGSLQLSAPGRDAAGIRGPSTPYERDGTIPEIFRARVDEHPDASALSFPGGSLTYSQLERRSNRLAHRLRSLGVGRGARVAVCMERSPEMVSAFLAVLKAGGAYVPLDPRDPPERLRLQMDGAGTELVLTLARHREQLPGHPAGVVCLDDVLDLAREPDGPPSPQAGALDAAYVMFTSGSTGSPKGVEVPHRAVLRLVRGADYVHLGPEEVVLGLAPPAFDASTFELWGALLNGGRLALAPPGPLSLAELREVVATEEVTTMWLTAGLFSRVVDGCPEILSSVRQLLAGGDVLSPDHARRALLELPPGAVLINGYGPTEATTFTCAHRMDGGESLPGPVPIGRPIANTSVHVLDEAREQVPVGVTGELFIGGDGLALGYAGEPTLTGERFPTVRGERLYRTGDLVRERADGLIEFVGRVDRQLKIRGFRVEPGEVEEVLRAHPDVADAVVVRHEQAGLAAHVVPRAGREVDVVQLRAHAALRLALHAVPTAWSILEQMPLTANGKIDAAALPQPVPGPGSSASRAAPPTGPRPSPDGLERALTAIWCRTLGVEHVHPDDDFFDLGGHSLLAVELFDEIARELDVEAPLASIFEAPTVRQLAAMLRQDGWRSSRGSLVTLTSSGRRPAIFMVAAGDGNSVGFGALARRLGEDQPFYALQPRGLNGGAPLQRTVEAMARNYVARIRSVQPRGPYVLGGRCLGSLVAYEMARRIERAGDSVARLIVLDSGGPLWKRRLLADGTRFDETMNGAIRRSAAQDELGDVFTAAGTQRLLSWLAEPVQLREGSGTVNRYLHEVYLTRSDVRDAYFHEQDGGASALIRWAWMFGIAEMDLNPQLLPAPDSSPPRVPAGPGLRERLQEVRGRVSWRLGEGADLISAGRRSGARSRRRERLRETSNSAAGSYRAGPYGGPVTLIRSEEYQVQPLLERWHALDTGGVHERRVRGTHRSMLREPDVEGLAACIRELVDEAL